MKYIDTTERADQLLERFKGEVYNDIKRQMIDEFNYAGAKNLAFDGVTFSFFKIRLNKDLSAASDRLIELKLSHLSDYVWQWGTADDKRERVEAIARAFEAEAARLRAKLASKK